MSVVIFDAFLSSPRPACFRLCAVSTGLSATQTLHFSSAVFTLCPDAPECREHQPSLLFSLLLRPALPTLLHSLRAGSAMPCTPFGGTQDLLGPRFPDPCIQPPQTWGGGAAPDAAGGSLPPQVHPCRLLSLECHLSRTLSTDTLGHPPLVSAAVFIPPVSTAHAPCLHVLSGIEMWPVGCEEVHVLPALCSCRRWELFRGMQ